jgi:hypothetical protein
MTDPRPVVYCPRCQCDVVALPSGQCPWCDRRLYHPVRTCACGARAIRRENQCAKCRRRSAMHNRDGFRAPRTVTIPYARVA